MTNPSRQQNYTKFVLSIIALLLFHLVMICLGSIGHADCHPRSSSNGTMLKYYMSDVFKFSITIQLVF